MIRPPQFPIRRNVAVQVSDLIPGVFVFVMIDGLNLDGGFLHKVAEVLISVFIFCRIRVHSAERTSFCGHPNIASDHIRQII